MGFKLTLAGVWLEGVTSISESGESDIAENRSVCGDAFCRAKGRALRRWTVELVLNVDDHKALKLLKSLYRSQKPKVMSVSGGAADFSARVVIKGLAVVNKFADCVYVTISALEYVRPKMGTVDAERIGTIGAAPNMASAYDACFLVAKYLSAGEKLVVKNPDTGAEVTNLASMDANTPLKLEKSPTVSKAFELQQAKRATMGAAYSKYAMAGGLKK